MAAKMEWNVENRKVQPSGLVNATHFLAVVLLFTTLPLFFLGAGAARGDSGQSGSCTQIDFSKFRKKQKLVWSEVARVIRQDGVLFANSSGSDRRGFLFFNQQAEILDEKGSRIQVRIRPDKGQPSLEGWADKRDFLCRNLPIKSATGLEMKFFIKTPTAARSPGTEEPSIPVYQDPELKDCLGGQGSCSEGASRFHMYFVFDQVGDSLLLADRYRLEENDRLMGWVSRQDGFQWNNAFGLRPSEALRDTNGAGPGAICTYSHLADAVAQNSVVCQPVVGGAGWFQSPLRIPVLDLVDANGRHVASNDWNASSRRRLFYKVAMGRPGLVARRVGKDQVAISPELASQILPQFKSLAAKKRVDIFFLLDATASMDQVFDAVRGTGHQRGVVQGIILSLKNTAAFKDTQFRFGFRVYRDSYADLATPSEMGAGMGDGIGEGHPLPAACVMTPALQKVAFETFEKAILRVQVSSDDSDDYPENLFGGLRQVLEKDIISCPDHLKLLFIIGDHGTRNQHQGREKYQNPVTEDTLVQLLRGERTEAKTNNVLPFFIQTPRRNTGAKNPDAYQKAYDLFARQARSLLTKSLPSGSLVAEHAFRLNEEKLVDRLVGTVAKLGGSELIEEIILDIRSGETLNAIIERLRRKRVDIPGLFWHILKEGSCGDLGDRCEQKVFDTTQVAFIEADEKVVEELWVSSTDMFSWIQILGGFHDYYKLPEPQLRRALIRAMVLGLQKQLHQPVIDGVGETPAQYAQRRGGMPVRRHSPLLNYNIHSIAAQRVTRNKDGRMIVQDRYNQPLMDAKGHPVPAVPMCELRRLATWAIKSKQILEIVQGDVTRPDFNATLYSPRACPDATPNGHAMLRIQGAIRSVPLGPDKTYRYSHNFGGRRFFWVPQSYLP